MKLQDKDVTLIFILCLTIHCWCKKCLTLVWDCVRCYVPMTSHYFLCSSSGGGGGSVHILPRAPSQPPVLYPHIELASIQYLNRQTGSAAPWIENLRREFELICQDSLTICGIMDRCPDFSLRHFYIFQRWGATEWTEEGWILNTQWNPGNNAMPLTHSEMCVCVLCSCMSLSLLCLLLSQCLSRPQRPGTHTFSSPVSWLGRASKDPESAGDMCVFVCVCVSWNPILLTKSLWQTLGHSWGCCDCPIPHKGGV